MKRSRAPAFIVKKKTKIPKPMVIQSKGMIISSDNQQQQIKIGITHFILK